MKYIIRADDLGYSEGINYGIYKSAAETKRWLCENGITCCTFSDFCGTEFDKIRK